MSDFTWTLTNTNETSGTPYTGSATFNYVSDWVERTGAFSAGPCGPPPVPWFTIGSPWGGELLADVPDINADPWLGPWSSMIALVQVSINYNMSWNCLCFTACTTDGQVVETKCVGGGGVLLCTSASEHLPILDPIYELDPPPSGPGDLVAADVGPVASNYARFQFNRDTSNPMPVFSVTIDNAGHYIKSQVTFWAQVLYDVVVPPPVIIPPPPVEWPTPSPPSAPPCGLFTPHL